MPSPFVLGGGAARRLMTFQRSDLCNLDRFYPIRLCLPTGRQGSVLDVMRYPAAARESLHPEVEERVGPSPARPRTRKRGSHAHRMNASQ